LIKTDLRNSLNNETLHYWMMVGLEKTDLSEFDFSRALQIWNSTSVVNEEFNFFLIKNISFL
jgi:hypothetical protein